MVQEYRALVSGLGAILAFGLTLPVTRFVAVELDPWLIGWGRAAVAGWVAAVILGLFRIPIPSSAERRQLWVVTSGVVLGFPLLSAGAMHMLPASHGGVVLGILPLLTAVAGKYVAGEQPSSSFWWVSLVGGVLLLLYLFPSKGLQLHAGDSLLLLAAIAAAVGYAFGGKLSQKRPGWQVICWALVFALPLTAPVFLWHLPGALQTAQFENWLGFLYLSLVSQLTGFFLWYYGLGLGGIARVGQLQLLQPFVTLGAAWFWLEEPIPPRTVTYACLIVVIVLISQKLDRP
jgi:drug/metabolite transporter (DMT)-like permease